MKQITKWVADDGKEFDSKEDCAEYESIVAGCEAALAPLGSSGSALHRMFSEGIGYVQHSPETVTACRAAVNDLARRLWPNASEVELPGRAWDGDIQCINCAYYRLQCFDKQGREWGQPYFANNPWKGADVCLEDRR